VNWGKAIIFAETKAFSFMQILLSCAKTMRDASTVKPPFTTLPRFKDEAGQFALELRQWTTDKFKDALQCSPSIASETKLRYLRFFDEGQELPAVLSYFGQVFKYLKVRNWKTGDFYYAQSHLWITSFLYGLLRPMDRIHPYRLEGKVSLEVSGEKTLFDFWKSRLTDMLLESVKADDGILLYLASEEMKLLFDWKRIRSELHVIQPHFFIMKDGRPKTIVIYTKTCRGAMAHYVTCNRISNPEDLKAFEHEGFTYTDQYGDNDHPNFCIL
jgi:cytoplasmic iron level regulating protein YaaA (DUF328/UPF0246 family)